MKRWGAGLMVALFLWPATSWAILVSKDSSSDDESEEESVSQALPASSNSQVRMKLKFVPRPTISPEVQPEAAKAPLSEADSYRLGVAKTEPPMGRANPVVKTVHGPRVPLVGYPAKIKGNTSSQMNVKVKAAE